MPTIHVEIHFRQQGCLMFSHVGLFFLIVTSLVASPLTSGGAPAPPRAEAAVTVAPAATDGETVVEEVDVVLRSASETVAADEPDLLEERPEAAEVVTTEEVAVADVAVEDRVLTPVVESDGFQTLGVTWGGDAVTVPDDIQVRTLGTDGWSQWVPLEIADDAPDAGTADARNAVRGGTDPLWVGEAEAVQLSFAAQDRSGPTDLRLSLIGSSEVEPPAGAAFVPSAAASGPTAPSAFLPAFVRSPGAGAEVVPSVDATPASAPVIITRAQWGAAPQSCTPSTAPKLVGAVVHHTAGSNTYATVAQAMQQIRNDQRYHMVSRGWCDLGYNFVVDKWGNIYEGRGGSLTKAVVGVHAGGFNTGTLGVSMLGTYTASPSTATQRAVAQIIGWRLGAYGVDPSGTMSYYTGGGENSKIPSGTTVTLPRVLGHRDVSYTACPGDGGYRSLAAVRTLAADYGYSVRFTQANAVVQALYEDILLRKVDPSGLQTWSSALAGGTGQPALVSSLTRSEEYIRLRITQAYREVLGREPDPTGMAHWYRAITSGTATVDDVKRRFYDSAEYFQRSGGTPEGYVDLLYRTMFERPSSAAEREHWVARMSVVGRAAVVDGIWYSFEAASYRAGGYYRAYLDREPDAAGQRGWATVLLRDGEHAVRVGIAGSEEYRLLALRTYGPSI